MKILLVLSILLASTASYASMCEYDCAEAGMEMWTCRKMCNP